MQAFVAIFFLLLICSCSTTAVPTNNNEVAGQTPSTPSEITYYEDKDGDGYGDPNRVTSPNGPIKAVTDNTDCNDDNKRSHPGSIESENSDVSIDFNCDGVFAWIPKITRIQTTRSSNHFREATVVQLQDGRKIISSYTREVDAQGPVVEFFELTYSENNNLILVRRNTRQDSTIQTDEYTYDSYSNMLTVKHHIGESNDPVTYATEFTYDENQNLVITRFYNGDLNTPVVSSQQRTYDNNRNELTYQSHIGDITSPISAARINTYNSNGKNILYREFAGDFTSPIVSTVETSYDEYGNQLVSRFYYGDLNVPIQSSLSNTYDSHGNLLARQQFSGDITGTPTRASSFTYDSANHVLVTRHYENGLNGALNSTLECTYDSDDNLSTCRDYFVPTQREEIQNYSFDTNRNLITYQSYNATNPNQLLSSLQFEEYIPIRFPLKSSELIFDDFFHLDL